MKKLLIPVVLLSGLMSLIAALPGRAENEADETVQIGLSETTVLAQGRGGSAIMLSDGRTLRQTVAGDKSLVEALKEKAAMPRSLATADFDEDGTPDLVAGFGTDTGGILSFARGNVDALYAHSPEAQKRRAEGIFTDAPFLAGTGIFAAPLTVDFLGAGDFDADGHSDLVGAARGSRSLFWLRGNGHGGFSGAASIELQGIVTALTVGEINRADGLNEVVVGINGTDGPRVLVFEHPAGALRAAPEVFALPVAPVSLVLGNFDNDGVFDLAVGGGNNLLLISGRDRKLSYTEEAGRPVPEAKTTVMAFPFEVSAIAAGNFIAGQDFQWEIALLSKDNSVHFLQRESETLGREDAGRQAGWKETGSLELPDTARHSPGLFAASRLAHSAADTLLVNTGDHQLHILTGESKAAEKESPAPFFSLVSLQAKSRPVAALPMRLNVDALSDLALLTEKEMTPSIMLTQPPTAGAVINTNDSGPGSLRQAMLGAGLITFNIPGNGPHTINLASPLPTPPAGFVMPHTIDGTTQPGFNGSPLIVVNGAALAAGTNALTLMSDDSLVRGLAIVNSPTAVYITTVQGSGFNVVEGNYLGLMPDGTTAATNAYGVRIERADNNTIGGTTAAARNVIVSSSVSVDISGANMATATDNAIRGNYIGTNATGTASNLFQSVGIRLLTFARQTTVGGTLPGARNLISSHNIGLLNNETTNLVQGNYIGTDASGTASIFNNTGIATGNGSPNSITIGGTTPAARNLISGNRGPGISLGQVGQNLNDGDNIVQGNWIGLSSDGSPLPNGGGINLFFTRGLVGGTVSGAGNLIAHNRFSGIHTENTFPIRAAILGNSIHSNRQDPQHLSSGAGLGIDLVPHQTPYGVTPNDADDADTGPNDLQNFPVITSATSGNSSTHITGTLNSRTDGVFTPFRIEFFLNPSCDPSGHGEGRTYIGATTFNEIAPAFTFNFDVNLPVSVPKGSYITATATRNWQTSGATSEFSQCFQTTVGTRANRVTDFGGNGTSDLALFRPTDGTWLVRDTANGGVVTTQWGTSGDIPQPADYTGDGRTDYAVYRPSTGTWWIAQGVNSIGVQFGVDTDKPVAADFTGDGRAELAVYRPTTGVWYMFDLTTSNVTARHWGQADDKPVPQDYDNDGRADVAVYRPSNGNWYIVNSNDNSVSYVAWGLSDDKPVAGDYDGDGRADVAVWRPSNGTWYVLRSSNNLLLAMQWGTSGDVPQPGDYDGDLRNDFIVWRPSNMTWYILQSSNGAVVSSTYGLTSDIPASSPYRIE